MAEQHVYVDNDVAVTNVSGETIGVSEYAGATSLFTSAAVTEPDANVNICEITPPAGFYKVVVDRSADGSGTPVNYNAAAFKIGNTEYDLVQVPELGILYKYEFFVQCDGSTVLAVAQNIAASANITITASLTCTKLA